MNKWSLLWLLIIICNANAVHGQDFGQQARLFRQQLNGKMPDTTRIRLQLDFAQFCLYAGIQNPKYLDSARLQYRKSVDLCREFRLTGWYNKCLEFQGLLEFEAGHWKLGEFCYSEAIKNSGLKNERERAQEWSRIAAAIPTLDSGMCEAKAEAYSHAKIIYQRLNDKLNETAALKNEADARLCQGKLLVAETELLQVLEQLKALHFRNLHHTYFLLGAIYHLKGDLHKELYYCLETVKSMEATGDTASSVLFYGKLAMVYSELGMNENSIHYYKVALLHSKKNSYVVCYCIEHIIQLLIREGKKNEALHFFNENFKISVPIDHEAAVFEYQALVICYIDLGQYDKVKPNIFKMIAAAESYLPLYYDSRGFRMNVYSKACEFLLMTNRYKEADSVLRKILTAQKELIDPVMLGKTELFRSKIDSANGDYFSSIKHYQLYKKISDSLFNATKSKQIEELQISYETSQKEKNIQLLKKQAQIQEVSLEKKSTIANLMIVCLVFALILMAVLYNRYQLNRRNNLALEASQKEISAKNSWLEKLLQDNEWLLREVHHRVKNNLHVIMGLLQSQSAYLEDETALKAVRDSQHRVQTMSLIHQKLYKTQNVSAVYMPEYIAELVDYLKDSFETRQRIYFQLEIAPVVMDAGYVVPVGLILNEVITNAIRHAFPHSKNDTIIVQLLHSGMAGITLIITDNGRGLPKGFDIDQLKSFGMLLVKGLVQELNGTFILQSISGTSISISFNTAQETPPY
jgi:two-component system, sensor histidine kinase PdtaS